jgi:serine/threonine protein kinase
MSSPHEDRPTIEAAVTRIDPMSLPDQAGAGHRRVIGEFEVIELLGEGALAHVYLARQTSLGRFVALKVNKRTGGDLPEGPLLAGLEHDHIVKVFSAFLDADTGARGLCLQYVAGTDLGTVIRAIHANGRMPVSGRAILDALDANAKGEAGFDPAALRDRDALAADDFAQAVCRIGGRLADALAFAHARGVLHCDIKPANVLVTRYGRPMLADFNVSFDRARRPTPVGGTLPYMAPEHYLAMFRQPGGRVDERSDVFSLGVVLHELATGELPSRERRPLERVPRELAAVIQRCLEADAAKRYQSAGELAAALAGASELLSAQRALPAPGMLGRRISAHPVTALALAAVVPHLAASLVNIAYNGVQIQFTPAQERVFPWLVAGYNLIAYPLCFGTGCVLFWRIARALQQPEVDVARERVRRLGWWAIALGALGWLPGAIVFPLVLDLTAGPAGWPMYAHFAVSFTLAGLIGVVFSYLAIEYVAFRALFPRLGNPDGFSVARAWAELRPLTAPFGFFLLLACAVPLAGAVLLIVLADGPMTLGFRLLVAGLIGAGVAGVGIAERVTRKLRELAAVWHESRSRAS